MQYVHNMQSLKALERLVRSPPDDALIYGSLADFMSIDHLQDISSFEALSDDAEAIGKLIEEGIFIGEDVGIVDAG
jgi:hypothetical protein